MLVIAVGVSIAIAAFATWQVLRPRSIAEVLSLEGLRAGSEIAVQGTITAFGRENTSYGPRAYVQLDGNTACSGPAPWTGNLLVDPNGSYTVGESLQATVHFEAFSIDGEAAVWAPELACPFPALYRAIAVVLDAASRVSNMVLAYNRTDVAGWSRYDFQTFNVTGYDPNVLPVDVLKALPGSARGVPTDSANEWTERAAVFYVMAAAALGPQNPGFAVADRMTSLGAPASANGSLRFVDADSNGLVNTGDGLDVRLPATASSHAWQAYMVRIGNWSFGPVQGSGVHVIMVGPSGPLEEVPEVGSSSLNLRAASVTPAKSFMVAKPAL